MNLYNFTLTFTAHVDTEEEAKQMMREIEEDFMDNREGSWSVSEIAFHKVVYL